MKMIKNVTHSFNIYGSVYLKADNFALDKKKSGADNC